MGILTEAAVCQASPLLIWVTHQSCRPSKKFLVEVQLKRVKILLFHYVAVHKLLESSLLFKYNIWLQQNNMATTITVTLGLHNVNLWWLCPGVKARVCDAFMVQMQSYGRSNYKYLVAKWICMIFFKRTLQVTGARLEIEILLSSFSLNLLNQILKLLPSEVYRHAYVRLITTGGRVFKSKMLHLLKYAC